MIASWRGIGMLAAIAVVLAAVLVVDLKRTHAPIDRRLTHLDVTKVYRLAWGSFVVQRSSDAGHDIWKAGDTTLDTVAVDDVLRTLDAATWHRRGGNAGTIHATLDVDHTHIGIGDPLLGAAQTWLVVDGTPLLVDTWVAHALVPGELALHVQHPFEAAARADRLVMHDPDVELVGHPRRLGGKQLADPATVHALEQALADVEILDRRSPSAGPTSVVLDGITTLVGGACGDDLATSGRYGQQCIGHHAWNRVVTAAEAVQVDLHPVIGTPRTIVLFDGTVDAHDAQAAPLVHALVTPGTVVASDARALRMITVDGAALGVLPGDAVRRTTDGTVLQIAHADWRALQEPASAWADPTRWSEDPSAVTQIAIDKTTYQRGAVLGEWTPPAKLDDLAAALAHVQARDGTAAPTSHTITVTLAPPVGSPATHTLELGAHCAGRIDTQPVVFEPATCHALEAATH